MNSRGYTVWVDDDTRDPIKMMDDGNLVLYGDEIPRCLRCGHTMTEIDSDAHHIIARFCPRCGAEAILVERYAPQPREPLLAMSAEEAYAYMQAFVNAFKTQEEEE